MIVLDFYNLHEQPFGPTPDSRYLFLNPSHKEALESLIYGIEAGCGFVALIAMPGLGKTTLLFEALQILRDKARIVFLFQIIRTPWDLLRVLLSGLGVRDLAGSLVEMQLKLRDLLTEQYHQGRPVVLVIDEAQNLDESVLELVRMLSNFETARDKLIQIILSGQPQLEDNMRSEELLQLRQRVSIFAGLKPLNAEETALYIAHRLRVAGGRSDAPVFTKEALALIAQSTEGIPRNINNLCFNALSRGFVLQRRPIDRDVVHQAIAQLHLVPWRATESAAQQPDGHYNLKASVALQPEERRTLRASPVYSWADTPHVRESWLPRVAVAAVIFVLMGGALFGSHLWLPRPALRVGPTAIVRPAPVSRQLDAGTSAHSAQTASDLPAPVTSAQPDAPTAALPDPSMQANEQDPPAIPRAPSSFGGGRTRQTMGFPGTVLVTPGATLRGICVEEFGSCTPGILQQIKDLNPLLNNPDHIETGQTIRIPILAAQSSSLERPRTP
jgi:general secretion pathway protein A